MTPVLTIQSFGLLYRIKVKKAEVERVVPVAEDSIMIYDQEEALKKQLDMGGFGENKARPARDLPVERGMEGHLDGRKN